MKKILDFILTNKYINEVLLRVLLEKIKPSQKFSFVEEIKRVGEAGLAKLTIFKKMHYQKLMISRIQPTPKGKKIQRLEEAVRRKTLDGCCRSGSITKFSQNLAIFQKYIHCSIYIMDKVCMVTLREILGIKMLSVVMSNFCDIIKDSDFREFSQMWFGTFKNIKKNEALKPGVKTEDPKIREASNLRSIGTPKEFVLIENDQEHLHDQVKSLDNRSQFSDFSLKLNSIGRKNQDFMGMFGMY